MSKLIPLRLQPPRDRLLEEVKQEVQAALAQSLHAAVLANLSQDSPPTGC